MEDIEMHEEVHPSNLLGTHYVVLVEKTQALASYSPWFKSYVHYYYS